MSCLQNRLPVFCLRCSGRSQIVYHVDLDKAILTVAAPVQGEYLAQEVSQSCFAMLSFGANLVSMPCLVRISLAISNYIPA